MVNLRFVATKFPEISAYDVLGLLVYNCGIESVEAALSEIKSAQHGVEADALPCGHSAGIEFGESSWSCVVCGQPVRRSR